MVIIFKWIQLFGTYGYVNTLDMSIFTPPAHEDIQELAISIVQFWGWPRGCRTYLPLTSKFWYQRQGVMQYMQGICTATRSLTWTKMELSCVPTYVNCGSIIAGSSMKLTTACLMNETIIRNNVAHYHTKRECYKVSLISLQLQCRTFSIPAIRATFVLYRKLVRLPFLQDPFNLFSDSTAGVVEVLIGTYS